MLDKRTTYAFAAIATILLAFIYFAERGTLSTGDVARRSGHVLTHFVRDQVTQVSLVRGSERPIVLEREPQENEDDLVSWRISAPVHANADDDAVDGFVGALEWLMVDRTLQGIDAADRRRYGLDHPRFVVRFRVSSEEVTLRVGREAPQEQGVYVAVDGEDRAYVVGGDFVESIDHDVSFFRDKNVFPDDFYAGDARTIRIAGQGRGIALRKVGSIWTVERPERGWANSGIPDSILRMVREARASRFIDERVDRLGRYGLDHPWRDVRIERPSGARGQRRGRLRIGAPCGDHPNERYALSSDRGPVMCIASSELSALEFETANVRETRFLPVAVESIERIDLARGGRTLSVHREDEEWKLEIDGEERAADGASVTEWIGQLRDLRALGFDAFAEGAHGIGSPQATLTVHGSEDESETRFALGETAEDGAWARRGDESALVRFDASLASLLEIDPLRFRDRALVRAEAGDAREITVRRGETEERAVRGDAGAWRMSAPIEADADRVVVRELARNIAELRAERFVSAHASDDHGLASPRAVATVRFAPEEGEARTVTLRIGAETESGAYAQLEGDDAVFEISRAAVDGIATSLLSLDLLTVEEDTIARVQIDRDGETVADLRREGTAWTLASGDAPDADRTRALFDRIGTLRASGVVSYGTPDPGLGLDPPAVRYTIVRTEGADPVHLDLGAQQGEGDDAYVPVRRSDIDATYRLRADLAAVLLTYEP